MRLCSNVLKVLAHPQIRRNLVWKQVHTKENHGVLHAVSAEDRQDQYSYPDLEQIQRKLLDLQAML